MARKLYAIALATYCIALNPTTRQGQRQRRPQSPSNHKRVVAIGDVHGDLDALRTCLRVAGVVDTSDAWIGAPGTTLVSTGDVLDRGDEDWECLAYLHTLQAAARRKRGDVCLVLGNHEVLNVLGEMRFASTKSWHAAAEACEPPRRNVERDDDWARRARIRAFAPGGAGAAYLADLCGDAPVGRVCGDTLYCHGGLHVVALTVGAAARRKRLAKQNKRAPAADAPARELLAALNADAAAWLRGAGPLPAALGASESSPVWSRAYSHPAGAEPAQSRCGEAAKALDALGLRRMVVGHTPQITAGINACCGGRVYRIDTGLSSFYGGMKQCLEVVSNERPRVISSTPEYFW
ncbi:unnamed protein product [Pelagomonas calceolata]|uniref:Calcineurin-like phosphoesterase domain-containing protein n=2 Tax=Pelagomonas calceolata TaxID=35677 RepID=A0A8J2WIR0_9STRA|nr:unnamed protein product [Pelagomonas calceolata]